MLTEITDNNYEEYSLLYYNNTHCMSIEDYYNDIKTFKYIKSYFRRYFSGNEIKVDVLLNHFIYTYNCFGEHMIEIMFYYFEDFYHPLLKTIFHYFKIMPKEIKVNKKIIYDSDIVLVEDLYEQLKYSKREIKNV